MAPDPFEAYQDDVSIPDSELLYRMITSGNTKFEAGAAVRPQSNAFQDRRAEELPSLGVPAVAVSVYLESEMTKVSTTPADLVQRWGDAYGVASISAGEVRQAEQGVVRWPQPNHPEHGMVFALVGSKKTNGKSSKLAKAAKIVIPPPSPPSTGAG